MAKKAAGWILLFVGIIILALSGWYGFEAIKFISSTESTVGEVVEHKFTHGLNTGYREVGSYQTQTTDMYAPVVIFQTSTGEKVRFQANWSEGDPPAIGSTVPVRYPATRPDDARISRISSLFGGAAILFLLGTIFGGAGFLILRK